MQRSRKIAITVIVFALGFLAVYMACTGRFLGRGANRLTQPGLNSVTYYCREGVIQATYGDQQVRLVLPDSRKFVLKQVISASGIRYSDGKIEFWSKGTGAFVTENNQTIYHDGVAGTIRRPRPGTAVFTDSDRTFSLTFPSRFVLSGKDIGFTQSWRAATNDFGEVLALVTIPKSYAPRTNFSGAEFSIGRSSDPVAVKNCFKEPAMYGVQTEQVKLHGVTYTKFRFMDAGAGNLYETTSYRTKRGNECYVVEYTIHSTNIGMYSPDQGIREYDKNKMTEMLEKMVRSFKFL